MDDEHIKRRAYEKWEAEGRPEGEHERHWHEAEKELGNSSELPQTSSPAHHSGVNVPDGHDQTTSDAIPSQSGKPGSFKPGELASENK
ncbi:MULTISPECIES: DUF2934 domain-containing protein [unclassified Rhizobium]|jgi:hypothetical protein|uniref:DUF2934 domain-containing protein n=1 Tax=unclassified Rhizobium TaxID=2613769 RepID=UPI000DD71FF6|nr:MULTISPECIES: DUF2934 domain-containing protein [unclassified Rhizobium]MBB3444005.1 hypothetical protein [Rhizobium sp. BK379]MBB3565141.1 hypothetical protein [Rhizobium sp. BK512]